KTFDFDWVEPEELLEYDAVLIGTHTWDDGAMPYEVEDFYEEVEEVDISGRLFGVFGSGDSFYDIFGGAIDLVADRLENLVANVHTESLIADLETDNEEIERCSCFTKELCDKLQSSSILEKI